MNHLFLKTGWGALLLLAWANLVAQTLPENPTEAVEFDSNWLVPINGQTVDVSRFRFGNPIEAGEYDSEIWVNGNKRGNFRLKFDDIPEKPMSGLCFTPELFALLDLKKSALSHEMQAHTCHDITQILPDAKSQFDASSQRLSIDLPSNLVVQRPKDYISPAQWQSGVPAAYVKYQFNQYQYHQNDSDNRRSAYLGIQAGGNLGAWSLRHSGSYSWENKGKARPYRSNETYVQRDIDTWHSRLILGDFYTRSNVNSNFGIRGISLVSDTRMLPHSVTGYAPVVRGVANSNARVTVRQNGNVIYETNVAAGSFEINDLLPIGYGNDLHVEVLEADGSRREFVVPTAISSQMLRPKHWRYEATLGRYREGSHIYPHNIAQASVQYGLSNAFTLKTGATISKDYGAGVLGGIYSNRLGSWEGDFQAAQLKKQGKHHRSNSLSLSYHKNFATTHTYVYAKWQKYLSDKHFSLLDAVRDVPNASFIHGNAPKHRYQISLNQKLGEKGGMIYVSGASTRQYAKSKAQHEYQVGYSNHFKRLTYNLGFLQSRDVATRTKHNQIYANMLVPLDNPNHWRNSHWLDLGYQKHRDHSLTRVALNGTLGDESQFSYGLSGSRAHQDKQNTYSASLAYRASPLALNVNASRYSNGNQWGFGVSGAVVAHPRGITLSRELGETFAVIHAKHATGAGIRGLLNGKLDRFGNGIVPYITPYRVNHIGINTDNLPDEVEVAATGKDLVPRAHSVNLVEFDTTAGTLHTFRVVLADGQTLPPIAAEVFDEKGQFVGLIGQGGVLMTRGIADSGSLKIIWGNTQQCRADYRIHDKQSDLSQPTTLSCQMIEK